MGGDAERVYDGEDNDCDGRFDELVVCADGTGDERTISAAAAGAPDGGTIELCPGWYTEVVTYSDKRLTFVGGGTAPGDVVLDPGEERWLLDVSGDGAGVHLEHLAIVGETAVELGGGATELIVRDIDTCTYGEGVGFGLSPSDDDAPTFELSRSRLCEVSVSLSGDGDGAEATIQKNRMSGETTIVVYSGEADVRNNVFEERVALGVSVSDESRWSAGAESLRVYNNTFVVTHRYAFTLTGYTYDSLNNWHGELELYNNIFAGDDAAFLIDYTRWDAGSQQCEELYPSPLAPNLLWGFERVEATCTRINDPYGYDTDVFDFTEELGVFTLEDPLLGARPGRGNFGLLAGSPAVDAGRGEDADGSPADLGAFGGPDGDWWNEVDWLE